MNEKEQSDETETDEAAINESKRVARVDMVYAVSANVNGRFNDGTRRKPGTVSIYIWGPGYRTHTGGLVKGARARRLLAATGYWSKSRRYRFLPQLARMVWRRTMCRPFDVADGPRLIDHLIARERPSKWSPREA